MNRASRTGAACRSAPAPPVRASPQTTSESSVADSDIVCVLINLARPPDLTPGIFPGLRELLNRCGNILIQHMGVSQRALDVAVVHCLLHQLQVAAVAQ